MAPAVTIQGTSPGSASINAISPFFRRSSRALECFVHNVLLLVTWKRSLDSFSALTEVPPSKAAHTTMARARFTVASVYIK